MKYPQFALIATLFLGMASLPGCTAGIIAMQAIPAVIKGGSMAAASERSPFEIPVGEVASDDATKSPHVDKQRHQAECGHAQSQYWLAAGLESQSKESADDIAVYQWYRLAEIHGFKAAKRKRQAMLMRMSAQQVLAAGNKVRAWRPKTEDC